MFSPSIWRRFSPPRPPQPMIAIWSLSPGARLETKAGAPMMAAPAWFAGKVQELGVAVGADSAGNQWVTLRGPTEASLLVGSHLDSVPNGGWLDGCLGVLAGLEVLRRHAQAGGPPITLRLVDWA